MNPWRWRKAMRKRPRKCNGKSISEGAEQQSRCDELQSADYLFRWEETRTSPSWALFVSCKLSTCSFRAPRVGKSIIIQLEWLIFVGQFLSSFFAFFITPSLRPFSLFPFFTWASVRNEDNDAQSESLLLILRKWLLCFQSQQKFKEEQSFPWGACLSAGRAIVKRES